MISIEAVERSPAFRKWCAAFRESSGIDVHLLGGPSIESSLSRAADANPLCRYLRRNCNRCIECRRRFAKRLASAGVNHSGAFAMRCFAGLTVTAIPLKLGDGSLAFLSTAPTFLEGRSPLEPDEEIARRIANPPELPHDRARSLAREVTVIRQRKFHAAVVLLRLLGEHLSHMSLQMLSTPENGWHDEVTVRRACEIIDQRFTENLRLGDVAGVIGVSRSYLSHLFSKHMGLSFTRYIAGRRVIELKRLLLDSKLRVTEAMFAAGFQSVSQANRVFRSVSGMAPRQFRTAARK
jgi:AraC-like DNA-binding protein